MLDKISLRNIMPDSSREELNDLETWLPVNGLIDVERLGGLVDNELAEFGKRSAKSREMYECTRRSSMMALLLLVGVLLLSACSGEEMGGKSEATLPAGTPATAAAQDAGEKEETARGHENMPIIDESCDTGGTHNEQLERARRLAGLKHDNDSLTCGALLYIRLAEVNRSDPELQVEAMAALEETLYFMRVIQSLDLMGVDKRNSQRISTIGNAFRSLADAAFKTYPTDPGILALKGLSALETDGAYDVSLLQQAIETQPDVLLGRAQVRLGRMLFELPSILGGDFRTAIMLLEQAVSIDPANMQALYYLAEVYEQELEEAKAAATMRRMLDIEPDSDQLQMGTDMLRLAAGLALRIHRDELAQRLAQKRNVLLSTHPELLTRVSIAVGGHGGEHPLTGE